MPLDPRLYGHAPVERDVQNGVVMLTMAGVCKRLDISEATLRRNVALMRLRKVIGPATYRWSVDDINAYVASLTPEFHGDRHTAHAVKAPILKKARAGKDAKQRDTALQAMLDAKLSAYREGNHG